MANNQPFEQYLSATPTRIFRRDRPENATENPYIDSLRMLTNRIREFSAKFIRDKSCLRLARVHKLILKMAKYAPLEGRGWQPLPEFLSNNQAIINIPNDDNATSDRRFFTFLKPRNLQRHCYRATMYKDDMLRRHHLETLFYPILQNNVNFYKDQIPMNINVFSYFDDEGRARYSLMISRKNCKRVDNLLYWKNHYVPITIIQRLFKDVTKHKEQKHFCLRCLSHFSSENVLTRHKELCT